MGLIVGMAEGQVLGTTVGVDAEGAEGVVGRNVGSAVGVVGRLVGE